MNKAYLTIVVDNITCKDLKTELAESSRLKNFKVLAGGDILVADQSQNEEALPNAFWLYVRDVNEKSQMWLVDDATEELDGRVMPSFELDVMRQFGVCTEFKTRIPNAGEYGSPLYAVDDDAAAVEVADHGFSILADGFATTIENGDDGSEVRWLRIIMPSWFNPQR